MKKILKISTLVLLVILITGCGSSSKAFFIGDESTHIITDDQVSMYLLDDISNEEKVSFMIHNHTEKSITYGLAYKLEVQKEEIWHTVESDEAFNSIGLVLEPLASQQENIDFTNAFKKLPSGNYRVVKTFHIENEDTMEAIHVAGEFNIK